MSTTAKERFDQMMERCENLLRAMVSFAFAIIVLATTSFAGETSAATNNCYARLVADVRVPVEPSAALRVDGLLDRVSYLEAKQAVCQDKQNERLQKLEASLSNLVDSRVDGRCEKKLGDLRKLADGFYETRYTELKAAHDRFMGRVDIFLVVIGVFVAIVGVLATIFSIVIPVVSEHTRNKEWKGVKTSIESLSGDARRAMEMDCQMKAEFYFQLAKMGFEQYKSTKNEEVLEIVVKNLSQCIMHNVKTKNGRGAKSAISFLNVVLLKSLEQGEEDLPKEIVSHRKEAYANLVNWDWGFDLEELKEMLEESDVDEHSAKVLVSTMRKIFGKWG